MELMIGLSICGVALPTIQYAMDVFYNRKREWNKLVDRGMAMDFSWDASAKKYQKLYDEMMAES